MNPWKPVLIALLCLVSMLSWANDALLDSALEALVESNEPKETAVPAAPATTTANDMVKISRSDLNAWMQQQQLQAQVITNQSDNQLWTVGVLSVVWLITFTMLLAFMRRQRCSDYVNAIGLNLIIFATIFMVLVVETDQQLTAGAGILGAIAGYLFRSMQHDSEHKNHSSEKADTEASSV